MKERIEQILPGMYVCKWHSACVRFLRSNDKIGYDSFIIFVLRPTGFDEGL